MTEGQSNSVDFGEVRSAVHTPYDPDDEGLDPLFEALTLPRTSCTWNTFPHWDYIYRSVSWDRLCQALRWTYQTREEAQVTREEAQVTREEAQVTHSDSFGTWFKWVEYVLMVEPMKYRHTDPDGFLALRLGSFVLEVTSPLGLHHRWIDHMFSRAEWEFSLRLFTKGGADSKEFAGLVGEIKRAYFKAYRSKLHGDRYFHVNVHRMRNRLEMLRDFTQERFDKNAYGRATFLFEACMEALDCLDGDPRPHLKRPNIRNNLEAFTHIYTMAHKGVRELRLKQEIEMKGYALQGDTLRKT